MAVEGTTDNRKSEQLTNDLQIVHDSMLDGLGQLADYFGFSTVMGQLFGTLLLSAEPLSLDDMTARLGMSKASVSTNMRSLERMGMVRQVWVRGGNGRRNTIKPRQISGRFSRTYSAVASCVTSSAPWR